MLSDVEIAQNTKMEPITEVCTKIGLEEDDLELYGKYKAKISLDAYKRLQKNKDGKLILVTSINPTPAGEGKTTTMIGLGDGLNLIGKKTIVTMREPSLGPCFGIKGGACGGGYSQVVPMEDINLHFTGDIHATSSANNLIAAMLDNSIHQGNKLMIDTNKVVWKRVVDLNDRALRHIVVGLGSKANGVVREDGYDIAVASEIMGALCMATSISNLRERISRMIVAYTFEDKAVTVDDLKATGAVMLLLKDAIKPNIVQTLNHNPVLVHGGPFANIAHGCNSILATKLGSKLGDYVLTEAGFGADLGAEKFLDIACKEGQLNPSLVVVVASIRALKMHGGVDKKNLAEENVEALHNGMANLEKHISNMRLYGLPVVVAINQFPTDTEAEIAELNDYLSKLNVPVALSQVFEKGAEGGVELAKTVVDTLEKEEAHFKPLYEGPEMTILEKIEKVATNIYGAKSVSLSKKARKQLASVENLGLNDLNICVAKTQYSLSDDPTLLGCPKDFVLEIDEIIPNVGSGFIVVVCGGIMRMPGLPKKPAAENMELLDDGTIIGLF